MLAQTALDYDADDKFLIAAEECVQMTPGGTSRIPRSDR